MLEGKNNIFSLPWEIRSIFMQNCFIVSALQHGRRENPLLHPVVIDTAAVSRKINPKHETKHYCVYHITYHTIFCTMLQLI